MGRAGVLMAAAALASPVAAARAVYVAPAGGGDGTSWASPLGHPQDAASAASSGDEVWVAQGTYADADGDGVVLGMRAGVSFYGGFAGTETRRTERAVGANATVLDGEGLAAHVVVGATGALLDGFTVTGGNADDAYGTAGFLGGGMYNSGVDGLFVTQCRFEANAATDSGGGMYSYNSAVTVTDCTFAGNTAGLYGGGASSVRCDTAFFGCRFTDNGSWNAAGGMDGMASFIVVVDAVFEGNYASCGGAMACYECGLQVWNSAFTNNEAASIGGAIYVEDDYYAGTYGVWGYYCVAEYDVWLYGAWEYYYLAGYYVWPVEVWGYYYPEDAETWTPYVASCTFVANRASAGGGIYATGSSPEVVNCTFTGNEASSGGAIYGGAPGWASLPAVTNCILWGNTGRGASEIAGDWAWYSTVTYSCVDGGWPGEGNVYADPMFADPGHWDDNGTPADASDDFLAGVDCRLTPGSSCIDSADGGVAPVEDIVGHARVNDAATVDAGTGDPTYADMGAYEYGLFLSVTFDPAEADEGSVLAGAGTVGAYPPPASDLVVALSTSDAGEAAPGVATVTIPAGASSAGFGVAVAADGIVDGPRRVTIVADAPGWVQGLGTFTANDVDPIVVAFDPAQIWEDCGTVADAGSVRLDETAQEDVVVALESDRTDTLTVPAEVTIRKGQAQAVFAVTVIEDVGLDGDPDGVAEGDQTVTVTATPAGGAAGSAQITVLDNEGDADGDGLPDWWERRYGLDINDLSDAGEDPDGDGLVNSAEYASGSSPRSVDTDGDGLGDYEEVNGYGTDPGEADTDGDGFTDDDEIRHGTDPLDPESFPDWSLSFYCGVAPLAGGAGGALVLTLAIGWALVRRRGAPGLQGAGPVT